MELNEFLKYMESGQRVYAGSEMHKYMHFLSSEAQKLTAELNGEYHTDEEKRELFSRITGGKVDGGFGIFPPFTTDCGKNIHLGENVFINAGCRFQDQGGIYIGSGALIGHNVVIATLNHAFEPERRGDMFPAPVRIGKNVWIGSCSTILPGVTIGDNAIIGAGSVVTRDIPDNAVAAGNPAKVKKYIDGRREGVYKKSASEETSDISK